MGNIREKLVFTAFVALFIGVAFFLLWRESAQVNLKSGMRLFEANDAAALSVLKNGVKKNPYDYLLHYGVARTLHKAGFVEMSGDGSGRRSLFEARRSINSAMALRFDSYGHQLLAFNYELTGEELKALAHYNISFFFSQDIGELKRWERLRQRQSGAARKYFDADDTGISLIMIFNSLTGYETRPALSSAESFIKGFFLSVEPADWLQSDWPEGKLLLKNRYEKLADAEKKTVTDLLEDGGFSFLAQFLRSST